MAQAAAVNPAVNSKPQQIIPIKVGVFGGQGSGKSTSTALMAVALSKELYGGAPVFVTDTEPGWQFLRRRVFAVEGVDLIQRTDPTFKAMVANLQEAEKLGCCVWAIDSLTIIWQELMQSFKKRLGYIPIDKWGDIKQMWNDYTTLFLNTKMNTFALGRLGNEMEEVQDDSHEGKTKLVKTGTKLKAGGGESFGYEPHLLLELSLERKAKTVAGSKREGEGRMVHRVDVLKDRTWALNGKTLRWSDKGSYEKGGYRTVWQSIKPHFDEVQLTMGMVQIKTGTSSAALINDNGNSEFYEKRKRRDILFEEIKAVMDLLWGGSAQAEKRMRLLATEHIFGIKSKEAVAELSLEKLERGYKILQAFEKRCKADGKILGTSEENILSHLDIDTREFDEGTAVQQTEEAEYPF